ncbi:MAG: MBOAT family protein [Oscillospiraceae bacterium]|nr:MBOAT family protein [Oscillospiraceae bacterium]
MLFNSLSYMVFLPLVVAAFFALPQRFRWVCLLAFSYFFYMSWNPNLIVLIAFTTLTSFVSARIIESTASRGVARAALVVGIVLSLACLFFFKYFNFFSESVFALSRMLGFSVQPLTLQLLLPVGISFYTFQTLSYVIDVYKGKLAAERHLGIYALYVSFFPQLVAGPIERATALLPQFRMTQHFSSARLSEGLRQIIVGMFKKVVIADFAAKYVNLVYNDISGFGGLSIILATLLFTVQIYCDFSGYSEIAIGSAKILGFDLMQNFKSPYFAKSMKEFWRRWHISLSTWFSDYIYIPLGGSRVSKPRYIFNIILTFLLSGLWHGAAWTFVLWGLYHGVLLAAESFYLKRLDAYVSALSPRARSFVNALRTLFTFALVNVGWVIFRANSLADLGTIFANITHGLNVFRLPTYLALIGLTTPAMWMLACMLLFLLVYDAYAYYKESPLCWIVRQKPAVRYAAYYVLSTAALIGLLSVPIGAAADFIYFQF